VVSIIAQTSWLGAKPDRLEATPDRAGSMLEFLRIAVVRMLAIVVFAISEAVAPGGPRSEIDHLAALGAERAIPVFLGRARGPLTYRTEHMDDRLKNCQMASIFATESSILIIPIILGSPQGSSLQKITAKRLNSLHSVGRQ